MSDDNKIQLSGIFENGYGIIPKKLMKLQLDKHVGKQKGKNIKLVLAYMLSYTGSGNECFPSIDTISKDLEMSKDTIIEAIKNAHELKLIDKQKMFPNDPLKRNNKYKLSFMDSIPSNIEVRQSRLTTSDGSTFEVVTIDPNNNSINNNKINNNINGSISNEEQLKEDKNQENFEDIWRLYPIKCPIRKANIRVKRADCYKVYKQLLSLKWEDAEVFRSVQGYVKECENTKSYMKQLPSLLSEFKRNKPEDYMD